MDAALQRDHETTLEDWLRERRDRDDSYDIIAWELTSLLEADGFSVTSETARQWCQRLGLVDVEEPAS